MEYFIPAWHDQYNDWSISIPAIDALDATGYMRILKNNKHQLGLIVSDYQPQLTTKLNQESFYPDKLFSIYDYLQGIDTLQSKVVELSDFNWPENALFDFSPFRTLIVQEDKLIATVFYDLEGKILRITYKKKTGEDDYTLLMDSRGFVSSKINQTDQIFYDPYGNWRFKRDYSSGEVTINTNFNFCQKNKYISMKHLINEVLKSYLIANIQDNDNLLVSLDEDASFDISLLNSYKAAYIVNEKLNYENQLSKIKSKTLIVNSSELADKVKKQTNDEADVDVIPIYNSQFQLGHSAREKIQTIVFFAENANDEDIAEIILNLCKYVKKDYKNKRIIVFTYSLQKNNLVNEVVEKIKKEHSDEFVISEKRDNNENADIVGLNQKKLAAVIELKSLRLTNISELLESMDRARVLISWGKADELMQMAAISIGIPQIQNFASNTVKDQKNGYLCSKIEDIKVALDKYLNSLTNWNNAVVYNVDMMNKYSEENIMKRWQRILGDKQ